MKVEFVHGSVFDHGCEAIVNPVNCVGAMGAGLALKFKKRFPDNFKIYADYCRKGEMKTGRVLMVSNRDRPPAWIANFPTKDHWRDPSRMEWIKDGLLDLRFRIDERGIKSVALPALGCGLGGLNWRDVRTAISDILGAGDSAARAIVCTPGGRP